MLQLADFPGCHVFDYRMVDSMLNLDLLKDPPKINNTPYRFRKPWISRWEYYYCNISSSANPGIGCYWDIRCLFSII